MSDQPNPFSREGSTEPPRPSSEPDPWPTYPPAPIPSQYEANPPPPNPYGVSPYAASPYGSPYGTSPYGTSPYGPTTYGTNPYAAASYGYTPANHPQAVMALVLGVVGLVICSYLGIAAFIVGGRARKEILAQPQCYAGLGMATAGWVMGIVGMVFAALFTLFVVIGMAGGWDS